MLQINDLTHIVVGGDIIDNKGIVDEYAYNIAYNQFIPFNTAAIKELDTIVQAQALEITQLKTEITNLNNALQSQNAEIVVLKTASNELVPVVQAQALEITQLKTSLNELLTLAGKPTI